MDDQTLLEGYSDAEKGAYLSAIASIATADREASEEELTYLTGLCDAAGLSDEQLAAVESAATQLSGSDLTRSLDVLKGSELRYSLIADLIAFAKSDQNYSEEEQQSVRRIGEYLGVNQQQFSLLNDFAQQASTQPANGEQPVAQSFAGLDGLKNKMQSAGINTSGLLKGLLAVAAPILISRFLNRRGRQGGMPGNSGGLGGMLGGGGLSSIIGMLNGGKGFGNAGGLLGKILGGGF